jgi:hypothetical protein
MGFISCREKGLWNEAVGQSGCSLPGELARMLKHVDTLWKDM